MFGLTKREQRWKAEQKAAELLFSLAGSVVEAATAVRVAEAEADAAQLKRLQEENMALLRDLRASTNVINIQLQTIKELEAQLSTGNQEAAVPEDVARDAARYRWLRDSGVDTLIAITVGPLGYALVDAGADAAIDAAMRQAAPEVKGETE